MKKIRVLIVDDSSLARKMLGHIFSSDPDIEVVGTAGDGQDALAKVRSLKPDVITMDLYMPKMNGYETTRKIMETYPVPILIVTTIETATEVRNSMKAIEAGALAALKKPSGIGTPEFAAVREDLISKIKLYSEVKLVKRFSQKMEPVIGVRTKQQIEVIAIGASTGGPPVLQSILSKLPKNLSCPVLVVQHMTEGFTAGFTDWLREYSSIPVSLASDGTALLPGNVYIAPDGFQMKVENGTIALTKDEMSNNMRPSISYLFSSIAPVFGNRSIGILLTGIGRDGAEELKMMKDRGAITIAQDKESCVVFGMPGEAINLDAATYVLSPEKISEFIAGVMV